MESREDKLVWKGGNKQPEEKDEDTEEKKDDMKDEVGMFAKVVEVYQRSDEGGGE